VGRTWKSRNVLLRRTHLASLDLPINGRSVLEVGSGIGPPHAVFPRAELPGRGYRRSSGKCPRAGAGAAPSRSRCIATACCYKEYSSHLGVR